MSSNRAKWTYENMDVMAVEMARHADGVTLLRRVWRARILGLEWRPLVPLLRDLLGDMYGELADLTWPGESLLNRWERDHGYQSR
jgi:hypothetical protein